MIKNTRRVVTGIGQDGKSTAIFDGYASNKFEVPDCPGFGGSFLWMSDESPASNQGIGDAADAGMRFPPSLGGSCFYIFEYPPLSESLTPEQRYRYLAGGHSDDGSPQWKQATGMHKTNTMEYIVVISGELTMVLESTEVTLRPGDTVVDRGVHHAWRNRGTVPAIFASIAIDAKPLE